MFNLMYLLAQVSTEANNAVVTAVNAAPKELPNWVQIILTVLSAIITAFLIPYMDKKSKAIEADIKLTQLKTNATASEVQASLLAQLELFVLRTVGDIFEREFMDIVQRVTDGTLRGKKEIKAELKKLKAIVRKRAIRHFDAQGIDLIAAMGDKILDGYIETAVNKLSPFPGKETAKALLTNNVSNWVVKFGVKYAKNNWLDEGAKLEDK